MTTEQAPFADEDSMIQLKALEKASKLILSSNCFAKCFEINPYNLVKGAVSL